LRQSALTVYTRAFPTSDLWDSGFTGLFAPCSCSLALSGPGKVLDEHHHSSCPALWRERLLRLSGRTALRLAFPVLLAGRDSCDYDGDSVPMRLAPGRGSRVPSREDVRAPRRCLIHHLHETSVVPILSLRVRRHGYFVPGIERLWPQAFCQRMCPSIIGD